MLNRYTGLIGLATLTVLVPHPVSPYCPPKYTLVSERLLSVAVWLDAPDVGAQPQPSEAVLMKFTYPEYFPGHPVPLPPPPATGIPYIVIIPPPPKSIADIVPIDCVVVNRLFVVVVEVVEPDVV